MEIGAELSQKKKKWTVTATTTNTATTTTTAAYKLRNPSDFAWDTQIHSFFLDVVPAMALHG